MKGVRLSLPAHELQLRDLQPDGLVPRLIAAGQVIRVSGKAGPLPTGQAGGSAGRLSLPAPKNIALYILTMEPRERSPEELHAYLLEMVNAKIAELGESMRWKRLPEWESEFESLRGKTILMVDDVQDMLTSFLPILMVATEGHANVLLHHEQTAQELAQQILTQNPDIVLLDNSLSNSVRGPQVASELRRLQWTGFLSGFSSDRNAQTAFSAAGANGFIEKDAFEPAGNMKRLAIIISETLSKPTNDA